MKQACVLFKRKLEPDQALALWLAQELGKAGFRVFLDRHVSVGLAWAQELELQLRQSDLVVVLLSEQSVASEMLAYELEMADAVAGQADGCPEIMPVRMNLRSALPEALGAMLHHREFFWEPEVERHRPRLVVWRGPGDDQGVLHQAVARLNATPDHHDTRRTIRLPATIRHETAPPEEKAMLEPLGGAVPLDSPYYITRTSDEEFAQALRRRDSVILVKGARQMGKTSLLARGLKQARASGMRIVLTDLQKLHSSHFASQEAFFMALAELVCHQLDITEELGRIWTPGRSPNANFERFWRDTVFHHVSGPVLWAFDEFDRLFGTGFGTEVCALLRSWHNERALDPSGPWRDLTTAICFATEAHLFITDLNQSPFNIGTRITLSDFTQDQFSELNTRYGKPIASPSELDRLHKFLGGHPYLCRCALQGIVNGIATLDQIISDPELDEGIFSDHLKRLLASLTRDRTIQETAFNVANGKACPTLESFYRLRTAGIVVGSSPADAKPRCDLYRTFIRRRLGAGP